MTNPRSLFTEAIEDHLALKKQNAVLEPAMPIARYDVGDPLERYPGAATAPADGSAVLVTEEPAAAAADVEPELEPAAGVFAGPSPEQAMEAATALEPAFADRPFEPLGGMTPMLSLVEDIDEEDDASSTGSLPVAASGADVLRFPGGVGPREEASADDLTAEPATAMVEAAAPTAFAEQTTLDDEPTGEQPILVIDADEPLAPMDDLPVARGERVKRPRFFGLGRRKSQDAEQGESWFDASPRDFNWD